MSLAIAGGVVLAAELVPFRQRRAARCRLAVLVLLYTRRHAMLAGEIATSLKSTYTHDEVQAAVLYLHDASSVYDAPCTIRWTTQGWLITDTGISQVQEALAVRTKSARVHHLMTPAVPA